VNPGFHDLKDWWISLAAKQKNGGKRLYKYRAYFVASDSSSRTKYLQKRLSKSKYVQNLEFLLVYALALG